MKKTLLIIAREFLTRVRKRSFIILTILGPVLLAALFIVPIYIAKVSDEEKKILVVDETYTLIDQLAGSDNITFEYSEKNIEEAKKDFPETDYYAILHIPNIAYHSPNALRLFSDKQVSLLVKGFVESAVKRVMDNVKLKSEGIKDDVLQSLQTRVHISTVKLEKSGKEQRTNAELSTALGIFAGVLIYFFVFMYSAMVMRGVIEEKSNRIVEIIVSSVRPFQLMMGKIIGIGLVGVVQFFLWIIMTFTLISIVQVAYPDIFASPSVSQQSFIPVQDRIPTDMPDQFNKADTNLVTEVYAAADFKIMILAFAFFFLAGYMIYSALFAAIGSAVDNETDTQQFMIPITAPLIFAFIMAQFIINNPEGPVAFWLSIIPLTSPIIMMLRIPFGVPITDIYLSVAILILTIVFIVWLAGKIYRVGILMYGKKITYKELWKWLKYKH